MSGDAERAADLRARVEQRLAPGERLDYCTWVGRAAPRARPGGPGTAAGPAGDPGNPGTDLDWDRRTRTGVVGGPTGCRADTLDAALPDAITAMVLAVTDARVLLLGETAQPEQRQPSGGLRDLLEGFRDELTRLVSTRPPVPRPIAPLEVLWQAPRAAVVHTRAQWGCFADRVVLGFDDTSWITVTAARVKHLAAALGTG